MPEPTIVVKQFFNEIDVSENHATTTVALQLERVECITGNDPLDDESLIRGAALTPLSCPPPAASGRHSTCPRQLFRTRNSGLE